MISDLSISVIEDKIRRMELSPAEVTSECLSQVKLWNPYVNAILTQVNPINSKGGDLTGIPYTLKDCYSTQDIKTTCASKVLDTYVPPYDATVVTKLKQVGALLIGKTNLDAWGHGGSTENTDYGVTKNPWDITRVPGGSSGGSAVAVSTGMCLFSIGEDTGGSIRNPAGWCNITGLKVTYGRVSRYGSIAYASSFDSVGPMAKTAEDCAYILNLIAGRDPLDATSSPEEVPDYLAGINSGTKGLRIGIPKEFFAEGLDPEVKRLTLQAAKTLEDNGAILVDVSLPMLKYAIATYYLLAPAETSSNLSRYDGIRFGNDRSNFSKETQRRIMIGTYALSAGYFDAYYRQAQLARTLIVDDYTKAFTECDVILAPISPTPATKIGELIGDPVKNMLADIFTVTTNPAGIPALALPCGFTSGNLPVGLQLQGQMFSEKLLLRIGHTYQQLTDWHTKKPVFKPE